MKNYRKVLCTKSAKYNYQSFMRPSCRLAKRFVCIFDYGPGSTLNSGDWLSYSYDVYKRVSRHRVIRIWKDYRYDRNINFKTTEAQLWLLINIRYLIIFFDFVFTILVHYVCSVFEMFLFCVEGCDFDVNRVSRYFFD